MRLATFALILAIALLAAPAFACDKCGASAKTKQAAKQKQDRARQGHYAKPKGGKKYEVRVSDMLCPNCVDNVEKALLHIDGVVGVEGDSNSKTVVVTLQEGANVKEEDIKRAVEKAGYTWGGMNGKDEEKKKTND